MVTKKIYSAFIVLFLICAVIALMSCEKSLITEAEVCDIRDICVTKELSKGQQAVLDSVKTHPGLNVPGISDETGIPAKSVEPHISVLIERNLIEHRGSKKTGGYYAGSLEIIGKMARAYKKTYLSGAMRNLAVMMDCGVRKYGYPIEEFYDRFLASDVSRQFAGGNPRYLVGMSGAELADSVVEATGGTVLQENNGTYTVGPEYWAGWALAYYQWLTRRSFAFMRRKGLGIKEVIAMYYPLHEADISKFVDAADNIVERN